MRSGSSTIRCTLLLQYELVCYLPSSFSLHSFVFVDWQILDADNGHCLESSTGRIATRDIVQFVPMREVHGEYIFLCLTDILPQFQN